LNFSPTNYIFLKTWHSSATKNRDTPSAMHLEHSGWGRHDSGNTALQFVTFELVVPVNKADDRNLLNLNRGNRWQIPLH